MFNCKNNFLVGTPASKTVDLVSASLSGRQQVWPVKDDMTKIHQSACFVTKNATHVASSRNCTSLHIYDLDESLKFYNLTRPHFVQITNMKKLTLCSLERYT